MTVSVIERSCEEGAVVFESICCNLCLCLCSACMLPETKASKNTERQLINAAGDTVLHTAVRAQARKALEVLLVQIRSGQLLQTRDAEGLTAAELAAQQNDARRTVDTTCLKQQQSMLQLFRLKGKGKARRD